MEGDLGEANRAARPLGSVPMTRSLRLSRRQALTVKRGIDVAGASVGLVVLSPLLAGTAAAIVVTQGRPVFFRHVRPGLDERPFMMVKFRTMRAPRPGWFGMRPTSGGS